MGACGSVGVCGGVVCVGGYGLVCYMKMEGRCEGGGGCVVQGEDMGGRAKGVRQAEGRLATEVLHHCPEPGLGLGP